MSKTPTSKSGTNFDAFKTAVQSRAEKNNKQFKERSNEQNKIVEVATTLDNDMRTHLMNEYTCAENDYLRATRKRETTDDFEVLKVLGHGAFGVVRLVRRKADGQVMALKQMPKKLMQNKNQRNRVITEKSVLAQMDNVAGVVSLHSTFQDGENLYLAMEFLPGGDFMSHLVRLDILSEEQTRFYMAELVSAVSAVHSMGFVHRDIKPDNLVLDEYGHLRLLDFGLCTIDPLAGATDTQLVSHEARMQRGEISAPSPTPSPSSSTAAQNSGIVGVGGKSDNNSGKLKPLLTATSRPQHLERALLKSSVGTPQYMAPEVFRRSGYTSSADFWSCGIIMFECLYGGVPFSDAHNNPYTVGHKVTNWKKFLRLPHPSRPGLSRDAIDLMKSILCEPEQRLTSEQIRLHPYFKGIDWDNLKNSRPPIQPRITSNVDTSNFAHSKGATALPSAKPTTSNLRKDLNFAGYTYQKEAESLKPTVDKIVGGLNPRSN